METFWFGSEMGYTVGPLVVSMLQSHGIDAAHCVTHPVTGQSRLTLYATTDRAHAAALLRQALRDVHAKVKQCADEHATTGPRRSVRVLNQKKNTKRGEGAHRGDRR